MLVGSQSSEKKYVSSNAGLRGESLQRTDAPYASKLDLLDVGRRAKARITSSQRQPPRRKIIRDVHLRGAPDRNRGGGGHPQTLRQDANLEESKDHYRNESAFDKEEEKEDTDEDISLWHIQ